MPGDPLAATDRSTLRRKRERGTYDRTLVEQILDEALICHVGFAVDGQPFVVPMTYGRIGDRLYLHGAAANHALGVLSDGTDACVTVTLLDGIVLARSAFHHSMNYRTVMLFGRALRVDDPDEKRAASDALLEHMRPGRSNEARPPTLAELRATRIVRFPIDEGSAKIRTGGPIDDPEDMDLPVWAGHIPMTLVAGDPVVDRPGAATGG